jgi:hypothetical protein
VSLPLLLALQPLPERAVDLRVEAPVLALGDRLERGVGVPAMNACTCGALARLLEVGADLEAIAAMIEANHDPRQRDDGTQWRTNGVLAQVYAEITIARQKAAK